MPVTPQLIRFGVFELDLSSGELSKNGRKLRLQEQPFRLLALLLEQPGQSVTRQRLKQVLWPSDTFVDFDHSLNAAMAKLRQALGDTAENPRFIETLPRRGYRFLGPVESLPEKEMLRPGELPFQAPHSSPQKRRVFPIMAVAGGALLLAAAVLFWTVRRSERNTDSSAPLPLTAAAGWERDAGFSPGGDQVVYAWDETGKEAGFHIYVKRIGSGRPVQLTSGPGSDLSPAWSPDGDSIAFIRSLNNATAIYAIPPLGGSERKLAEGYFSGAISWSPDGNSLVAAESKSSVDPPSLFLIAVGNGKRVHRLTTPPDAKTLDLDPAFSPDGRMLLFTRCDGPFRCGLYLLDLAPGYLPRGSPRVLRRESTAIAGATWTADGKEVTYALSEDGAYNPHLMRIRVAAGAQPRRMTVAGDDVHSPVIARHSNRLAYTRSLAEADLWQVQPGRSVQPFVSSTRNEDSSQYSPDGARVAFSSNRTGLMQVWVCDAAGRNATQLTHFDRGHSGTPRWSPDGHWIAFDRQLDEGWRIFVMAADGGQVRRLTSDKGPDEVIPSWSTDGKWIYYSSNHTGRFQVWKAPAQGGNGTQITHNGGWVAFESRDSKALYYLKYETPVLWRRALNGGEEEPVVDFVQGRAFAVVDDGIYYIKQLRRDGGSSINFHRFASRKNEEVASFKQQAWPNALAVAPDRKTIVFPAMSRTGSDIMILENFR